MSEEQLADERERDRLQHRARRANMTDEQREIEREPDRNQHRAANENLNLPSTSTNHSDTRISEEQLANERERNLVRQRTRRLNMTEEQRSIERERDRNRHRPGKEKMNLASTSTTNNEMHISEERLANERERNRVRQRTRRLNMTEEQRSIESGRDRNRYTAAKENLNHASTSTGNNDAHIFEHVIHRHVQAEVGRLIGRVSAIRMNTTEGYMELGPQHRAPIHTTFEDMLEFDEQINDPEEGLDESHEEDVQEEMIWMLQHYIFGGIKMFFTWFRNKQLLEMVQWGFHNLIMQTTTEKGKHYCRKISHMFNLLYSLLCVYICGVGQSRDPQSTIASNSRRRTSLSNRGFHNAARDFVDLHSLPRLQLNDSSSCNHCGAMLFPHETNQLCCLNRKVKLPDLPVPQELMQLYTVQSELGAHFRHYIRSYNHVFAFTSIGVRIDHDMANSKKGVYTYRAQGTMYHKIRSLIPEPSDGPRFLQMYIYDTEHELENRFKEQQFSAKKDKGKEHEHEPSETEEPLNREVLAILKGMLDRCNPYVRVIRQISQGTEFQDVRLHIKEQATFRRTYNMPTSPQVEAVLVGGEEPSEVLPRDIIVQTKSGKILNVPDTACFYDPLQYPLLHLYGSFGWDLTIFGDNTRRISCRAYHAYMLHIRENQQSTLLHAGKLLQQYVVDNYVKISTMQLRWVRDNQKTFRAEWYSGVLDALDSNTGDIGQRVILPPTYTGSPRDMHQRYHDAMALVQKYGKPDLFITMTCNPNWEEIQRELRPGQQAQDRPDLTTRVFHSKFEEMKTDLFTKGVLGKVVAHVHVIKFQKRGLPHAHILIILNERDKLRSPDDYDRIVRAEIPDPNVEPELYASVLKHMIHMPCALSADSICKKDGKCKKRFPKPFAPETLEGQNSYPVYRRRNDGREVTLSNGKVVNNSWVVPYNPWLLKKYESYQCGDLFKYTICEIFVQICL